ncbi:peptidoglycan DD-metalloendopeptidase family protein [Rhodococcus sp. IEGM 1379]|uniref:peptidoglycan DD-metalloendopeptidase family protein n=1 Tax=Rhodococcus sp. IEGM 1379 TaxID=3047086 RepID=UPI0024B661B7|nr:peptidoglycan DD-metalloendopeptidase family protein [Rhodococcus sp. IEGM 1379]MDI9913649.1 peptidoglycan DD-metalloendopeptidase family protein [Rhodococcus sp. IEGM 1379]
MSKHSNSKASNTKRFIAVTAGLGSLVGAGVVVNAGTAAAQGWSESCSWEWPVEGSLSQGYNGGHDGVDFAVNVGTVLNAPTSGTISVAGPNDPGGYGTYIQLEADSGEQIQMGHLSETWVNVGQHVEVGAQIGATGNTGSSTGPHLHLRIHGAGAVDPMSFLKSVGACNTGSGSVAAPEPAAVSEPAPAVVPEPAAMPELAPEPAAVSEPAPELALAPELAAVPEPASEIAPVVEPGLTEASPVESVPEAEAVVSGEVVVVSAGDTLFDLGAARGLTWQDVWDMNPQIDHPDSIFVGDVINL